MIMKKFSVLLLALGVLLILFSQTPIYTNAGTIISETREDVESDSFYCGFDFDNFIAEENNFVCNVNYNYDDIPIITSNGNIGTNILLCKIEGITS